ncbi:hypothetical protein L7F22_035283 [Adiantum nelumboides]|nr:hypothetical protein [Adiantum nelumboides]
MQAGDCCDDQIAVVKIPTAAIGSNASKSIAMIFVMLADQLVSNSHLVNNFLVGLLPFITKTKIYGCAKVLFIKCHVDITSQCSVSIQLPMLLLATLIVKTMFTCSFPMVYLLASVDGNVTVSRVPPCSLPPAFNHSKKLLLAPSQSGAPSEQAGWNLNRSSN